MPNVFGVFSYPTNASGVSVASSASSWVFGSWVTLVPVTAETSFLCGFTYQVTSLGAVDTTYETLFEIAFGAPGSEEIVVQIPCSFRPDTQVGQYMQSTLKITLPEVIYCPPGTTIRVRVTDSVASALTYNGVKVMYQNDIRAFPGLTQQFENYKNRGVKGKGLSVNIGR